MPRDSYDVPYIFYESYGSVKKIDQNKVSVNNTSQFPRDIYKKESFNPGKNQPLRFYGQDYPDDKRVDYLIPKDLYTISKIRQHENKQYNSGHSIHPPYFSRFGYSDFPNGYGVANHPGRYNTPVGQQQETSRDPPNMAPKRFYEEERYLDPTWVDSPAYRESRLLRGLKN